MRCFRQYAFLCVLLVGMLCTFNPAHAAMLGIPSPQTILSGIGVISGWKCDAGDLTIRFNGGPPRPLLHGARRQDVLDAGACPSADVGFVSIMNWSDLGDGEHTAVAYDDGVAFARSRFRVVTPRYGFTPPHVEGECIADDFPEPGDRSRFLWNPATQHMELVEVREWYDEADTPDYPATADLDFLLDRKTWTIEVPDVLSWKYVSEHEHPEWDTLSVHNGGPGGNRYVSGPAEVTFLRYVHGQTPANLHPIGAIPPWGISLVGRIQGTRVKGVDRLGNVVLEPALPRVVEVGTLANGVPYQTREAINELGEAYSLVVPMSTHDTTQDNRCYILVFDDFRRTPAGGLETQARFYRTARSPYVRGEPRSCVPPIYPGGLNGRSVPSVTTPHYVTRLLIY